MEENNNFNDIQVKQIEINGVKTQYFLFSNGDLFNILSHKCSKGAINHGYIRYNLYVNGENISIFKHQLLAQTFIPNPEHKKVVHHINGCIQDNRLENLEWVTQEENVNKIVNKPIKNEVPTFTEKEIANEEWAPFRKTHYLISNLGRIKNLKTGRIGYGSPNKNSNYVRFTYVDENGMNREIQLHRAVYEAFHPDEEIDVIDHIDSNRRNNRLSNLANISQQENVLKSYYVTKTKETFFTAQYDLDMNLIAIYPSQSAAGRAVGLKYPTNIRMAVKTGGTSHGYYWRRVSQDEYEKFLENQKDH